MTESTQPELAPADDVSRWSWTSWQVILLIANAVCGLAWFEWAWWFNRRFRTPMPELHDKLPGFRRVDPLKWRKWRFYIGAMTLLIPRFVFGCLVGLVLVFFLKLILIGAPEGAIGGWRKVAFRWFFKSFTYFFTIVTQLSIITWTHVPEEEVNFYEEYLGPRDQ